MDDTTTRLSRFTTSVTPTQTIDAVPSDPDDNRILECAVESNSDYLVTGDNHPRGLGIYDGIRIIRVFNSIAMLSS